MAILFNLVKSECTHTKQSTDMLLADANVHIRQVCIVLHPRQKILNWYGHIRRREEDTHSRKMMDMVVPGKRRRGGLDGDGLAISRKILNNMNCH